MKAPPSVPTPTFAQVEVLRLLSQRQRQTGPSTFLGRVSGRCVSTLVARGWAVAFRPDSGAVFAGITAEGRKALARAKP